MIRARLCLLKKMWKMEMGLIAVNRDFRDAFCMRLYDEMQ